MTAGTDTAPSRGELWSALRERLERERAELIVQLRPTADDHLQPTATTGPGETEHITSEVEQRVQAVLDAAAAVRLVELDDALRRLDDGSYGRCERCGHAIAFARLEALPHVSLCLQCQQEEDAQRRPRAQ